MAKQTWLWRTWLAFLLVLLPSSAFAITVTGTLYTNTRWTKTMSPVIMSGDVTVDAAATLTIDPGVVVQAAATDGQASGTDRSRVELIIQGTLLANGTDTEPILFEGVSVTSGSWYGLVVPTGGKATISYASIGGALNGLTNNGTTGITDSQIHSSGTYGVRQLAGTLTMTRAKVHRSLSYGIFHTGGVATITSSQIYRNQNGGVYTSPPTVVSSMTLDHCTITLNQSYGVYVSRQSSSYGAVNLRNSIIDRNGSGTSGYEIYSDSASYTASCVGNLIWDNVGTSLTINQSCSFTTSYNPLYVDLANDDFRIFDRSPARRPGHVDGDIGALPWTIHQTNVLHGYLLTNLTLPAGNHTVQGDLVVRAGVTLTLEAGANLRFDSYDDMVGGISRSLPELIVEGKLVASGTQGSPVTMQILNTGNWYGLRVPLGGDATLNYVSIQKASYGLEIVGTVVANDLEIQASSNHGIQQTSGTLTLTRGKIHRNQSYGIFHTGGTAAITYTQIYRNSSSGVYSSPANSAHSMTLDHCTIFLNSSYGVYVSRQSSSYGAIALRNSIVARNGSGTSGYEIYSDSASYTASCSANLLWDSVGTSFTINQSCSSTTSYNPLFVDEANDDFRIFNRSPARRPGHIDGDIGALPWTIHQTNVLHGYILSDLTLSAGNHSLTGDLVVRPGVTLTLEAGANLQAAATDDMVGGSSRTLPEIIVEGKLIGTALPTQKITFQGTGISAWYGLRVLASGQMSLRNVSIQKAFNGIETAGTTDVSDTEIQSSNNYGVQQTNGTLTITRGKIHRNLSYGVFHTGGVATITYTQIYRNSSSGVYTSPPTSASSMTLDHCTIILNQSYGVYVSRQSSSYGAVTLRNNIIARNGSSTSGYEIYSDSASYTASCSTNLLWDSVGTSFTVNQSCSSTTAGNPLFVDEANDDFHLTGTSPARNKATDGTDLGALPFQPTLTQILITPATPSVEVEKTVQFTAEGLDSVGSVVAGLTFTWKVVNGGGSISASGLFTAGTQARTFVSTVEATSGSIKGYATVTVTPGIAAKITITPLTASIKAGDKRTFQAAIFDRFDNPITGKTVTWAALAAAGSIASTGELTSATKTATVTRGVSASVDGITGYADVTILPHDPAKVIVSPNPGNVAPNKTLQFSAQVEDTYTNVITGLTITWSIVNGGGIIDPTGLFTANATTGTFTNTVRAATGSISGTATVVVGGTATIASVEVTPLLANLAPADSQLFRASALDSQGTRLTGISFTWSMPTGGGTLVPSSGLQTQATFTAGQTEGTFSVVAEAQGSNGVKGTASVVIKKALGPLARIAVAPAQATVKTTKTQAFTAEGFDASNNKLSNLTFTWSVSAGGGSIDASGLYTAGTQAGTYTITATSGAISGTAQAQVTAGSAPTTPQPRNPADKATVASKTPALEVANSTDADGDPLTYDFEIASDAAFATKVASGSTPETPSTTAWTTTVALQENATYFWRARASDGALQSAWSVARSFTVDTTNEPPTAPKLSSPIDGGSVSTLTPTLEVTNASDPEGTKLVYLFEIASDKAMTQIVIRSPQIPEGTAGSTSWIVTTTLKDTQLYYWRSWAVDAGGLEGAKMAVASFTVSLANKPPSPPTPRKPKDGDTVTSLRPSFEVANSVDPDGDTVTLDLEIDTVNTFDSPAKIEKKQLAQNSGGLTTWIAESDLKEDTLYFWRLRASDGKTATAWVFGGEFFVSTKNDPPTIPALHSPSDGTTVPSASVTLETERSTDPENDKLVYHLQISESKDFLTGVIEDKAIAAGRTYVTWNPQGLLRGKTYFWRARAYDGSEYSGWSQVWSLIVAIEPSEKTPEQPRETTSEASPDGNTEGTGEVAPDGSSEGTPEASTEPPPETSNPETSTKETVGNEGASDKGTTTPPGGCGCSGDPEPFAPFFYLLLLGLGLLWPLRRSR